MMRLSTAGDVEQAVGVPQAHQAATKVSATTAKTTGGLELAKSGTVKNTANSVTINLSSPVVTAKSTAAENNLQSPVVSTQSTAAENTADPTTQNPKSPAATTGGTFHLEEDIFSLLFISKVNSLAFVYSVIFFAFQLLILILIMVNLLKDAPEGNPLNVPLRTSADVIAAQALALFVSLITQNDVLRTVDLVNVEYDATVLGSLPGATRTKWVVSNMCRFFEGFLSITVSFIFIVQSTTVLEIFFNFAAVMFVSDLDNVAFELANRGYVPGVVDATTKQLELVEFAPRTKVAVSNTNREISAKMVRVIIFCTIMTFLFVGWGVIRARQANGHFFEQVCQAFEVGFGDDFFVNQKCDENQCEWKNRTRPLHYGPFSDTYEASRRSDGTLSFHEKRPVYFQRSQKTGFGEGSPPGKFSYCNGEGVWVFTIDGVSKAEPDECNWLLKSPKTDAYTLGDVPVTGWSIWTGVLEAASPFDITCGECETKVDCNYHGECMKDKRCECKDPWVGKSCQSCAACSQLDRTYDAELEYGESWEIEDDGTFIILDGVEAYGRPIYYMSYNDTYGYNPGSIDMLFHARTRFYIVEWQNFLSEPTLGVQDDDRERLRDYFANFHSTWHLDDDVNRIMRFYTDTTRNPMPIDVTWNKAQKSDFPYVVTGQVSGNVVRVDLKFECPNATEKTLCAFVESSEAY